MSDIEKLMRSLAEQAEEIRTQEPLDNGEVSKFSKELVSFAHEFATPKARADIIVISGKISALLKEDEPHTGETEAKIRKLVFEAFRKIEPPLMQKSEDQENETFDAAREKVAHTIRMHPFRAGREVLALARTHGRDPALRAAAATLPVPRSEDADPEKIERYQDALRKILADIAKSRSDPDPAALEAYRRQQETFARTRGRSIERRTVVRAENIGKVLRGEKTFTLKDVSLELKLGEITGVVGFNGSGKSTLFRLLVGEMAADSGTLAFPEFGYSTPNALRWADIRRQIAFVPQTLPRWSGSLEDNLRFAAASKGILGVDNDEAFAFITARLGLTPYLPLRWTELSGGFQLRFALAQALIWSPRFLVLDEPLAFLDFKAQLTVLNDIAGLTRSYTDPIAVLLSSQHLYETEAIAQNILYLDNGRVGYNGSVTNIGSDGQRATNRFELGCRADLLTLEAALQDKSIHRVWSDGLNFQIATDMDFSGNQLLFHLTSKGIDVTYFRDISRSVRHLFDRSSGATAGRSETAEAAP